MSLFAVCLVCHLVGDFLLQNHWMQRKGQSTLHCAAHVAAYALPFAAAIFAGILTIPTWAVWAILLQHFAQDRWALHVRWMRFYGHTTPDLWPVGPLCIDQAMHISFIGLVLIAST